MSDNPIKNPKLGTAGVDPGTRDDKSKTESKNLLQCQFCKIIFRSNAKLDEHRIIHEHYGHSWKPKKT